MEIYDGRMLLIYLAVKYDGDFDKICTAITLKDYPPFEEVIKVNKSLKCKTLTMMDYDYPLKLKELKYAPFVLFYYGDITLLSKDILAVVGARNVNDYGKYCAEKVISECIQGRVVISGLARGVDTIAHEAAIKYGGRTIAVLGGGFDHLYPPENKELFETIKKEHLVISEYPPHVECAPYRFPMRNRLITCLSDGIFIPQVNNYMSGTMISVAMSLDQGKEVFVAPDRIDSETINNQIIDEGATFTIDGDTIKTFLKWK